MEWKSKFQELEQKLNEQKGEFENLHLQLKEQFKNIATDIVNQNSMKMQEEHKVKLSDILKPL